MDTTALYAAADRISLHEQVLRSRAQVIGAQREQVRWDSPGARSCRRRLDTVVRGLLADAAAAGGVAEGIRAHAVRVAAIP